MSKYNESSKGELVEPINIPGLSVALSQFAGICDSTMMKEASDIVRNPILTEAQKKLSRYDEMLKSLHMESFSMLRNLGEDQTAWIEKYDHSVLKSFTKNMSNIANENIYNIDGTIRVVKEMMVPFKSSANISKMSEISNSISGLSAIMREVGSTSLISQFLKNNTTFSVLSQKTLEDVNINLLGRVTDQVFSESEEWDIDTMSNTIATEYEKATDISSNREKQKIDAKEIRDWLSFIITMLSFVIGIMNSSSTTINNYNYIQQVNNYYVVGMGYDVKELNIIKYRIINRESSVRLKHDYHSFIIAKLEAGQVVRIIDKFKKWRQIIWENEDGKKCIGWIQNYKLTEFKMPKSR